MYPFRSLPQELVDEIMGYVDTNSDLYTLSALSRSCKVFLPWCQRRIFSTIRFRCAEHRYNLGPSDPLEAKIEKFLNILQYSPHIAGYVRRLELSITTQYNYWVTEEPFIKIMEIINRSGNFIKELGLYAISFPEQFQDLRTLEQKFLQPFINPFITALTVSGLVSVPISLLTESVNLREFIIDHSALEHFAYDPHSGSLPSCPKLHTLTFNPSMGVLETILAARSDPSSPQIVDLSRLRVVSTRSYPHNLQAMNDIIQIARDSLEELHIGHNADFTYSPHDGLVDFSEASGLRLLTVDVVFPSCHSNLGDPLMDFCSVLNTLPNHNSLSEFRLCCYIGFYSRKDGPGSSFSANWKVLDSALVRISSGKPLLFHLHMVYSYDEESDASSDEYEGEMEAENNKQKVIEDLCEEILQKLAQEFFPLVNGSKHIIFNLSRSLEVDG